MASDISNKKPEAGATLTVAQFEAMKPEEIGGYFVSKATFFALTSLSTMTAPGAADATYERWIMTGRVKEIVTVIESPTGLEDDVKDVVVSARFVNAERRRANINARKIEAMRDANFDVRPLALRK